MTRKFAIGLFGFVCACGSSGTSNETMPNEGAGDGARGTSSATPTPAPFKSDDGLIGTWSVRGSDERGEYVGEIEFRPQGPEIGFVRSVRYPNVVVEKDRELHWVWVGTANVQGAAARANVSLRARDFIRERASVRRTGQESPVVVHATFLRAADSQSWIAKYGGFGGDREETLTARRPLGEPLFSGFDRVITDSHDPPAPLEKAALFAAFSSHHARPEVKPYVSRPEFVAAIHGHFVDKTDFGFYQRTPRALRVVNKTIDSISLLETVMRADAFRYSLIDKAAKFDREIVERYFEPGLYEIPDYREAGKNQPSPDGALWTGVYIASQAFRFLVTGEPEAKAHVAAGVDTLLKHQEITGDPTHFARVLRIAQGNPQPPWRAGSGAYAALEWRENGNNDMVKGLVYGYTMAHRVLCAGPGHESICARIRRNAQDLADHVQVDNGFDSPASENDVNHHWLAAAVTESPLDKAKYRAKAEALWAAANPLDRVANGYRYDYGIVGWSGTHLAIVSILSRWFLADALALSNAKKRIQEGFLYQYQDYDRQRFPLWNLFRAGTMVDAKSAAYADDARWRLREMPFPKVARIVDHRLQDDFCMSPYPWQPWKGSWVDKDKSTSLRSYPLFEDAGDVYHWKNGFDYNPDVPEGIEFPGADYLHAYWLGRYFGLLTATE